MKEHRDMVNRLVKDGQVIADELSGRDAHLIHMIMGICGEAGELLDAVKKAVVYRKPLDMENIVEELGDIEFYMEGFRQGLGIQRDETLTHNIEKLNRRYSAGSYSDDAAKTRADKSA